MSHEQELARALDACVAALRAGQPPEQVLAAYPALRAELEPLLRMAVALPSAATAVPSPRFRAAARARLMATARADARAQRSGLFGWLHWPTPTARWSPGVAATLLALVLLATFTVSASASALPGDALYPVKRLAEQAELSLTRDEDTRADLQLRFMDRRLEEALALAGRGEAARATEAVAAYAQTVEALSGSEVAASDQRAAELVARLEDHQARLAQVLAQAPEPARPALEHALANSRRGLERASAVQTQRTESAGPEATPRPAVATPGPRQGPPAEATRPEPGAVKPGPTEKGPPPKPKARAPEASGAIEEESRQASERVDRSPEPRSQAPSEQPAHLSEAEPTKPGVEAGAEPPAAEPPAAEQAGPPGKDHAVGTTEGESPPGQNKHADPKGPSPKSKVANPGA